MRGLLLMALTSAMVLAIRKPLPLKQVLAQEEVIVLVAITARSTDPPQVKFQVRSKLKGEPPVQEMILDMTGDAEAIKLKQPPELLPRLTVDREGIAFLSQDGEATSCFAFVEGTWFSAKGQKKAGTWTWKLAHAEPYLRRTFAGTTAELKSIVEGKTPPPEWNEKQAPGYGPLPEKAKP
ncbi:MAG: hypothetical protein ACRC8S_07255 [Fimbriiglobus sp.]